MLVGFLMSKALYGKSLKGMLTSLNLPSNYEELVSPPNEHRPLDPVSNIYLVIVYTLFTINFIGIFCARSLHYQFYSWYYYTIPFFVCFGPYTIVKLILFFGIEYVYMSYPPQSALSQLLLFVHLGFLLRCYLIIEKTTPHYYVEKVKKLESKKED